MSVPASYNQAADLAGYLHRVLGKTATIIGWTEPDSYDEVVIDALILYGVDALADATDIPKLRACARLAVWQAVAAETAGYHAFSEDSQTFQMHQVHQHATARAKDARRDALSHGIGAAVIETTAIRHVDPYVVVPDSDRAV